MGVPESLVPLWRGAVMNTQAPQVAEEERIDLLEIVDFAELDTLIEETEMYDDEYEEVEIYEIDDLEYEEGEENERAETKTTKRTKRVSSSSLCLWPSLHPSNNHV